jgi:hypothetical protein
LLCASADLFIQAILIDCTQGVQVRSYQRKYLPAGILESNQLLFCLLLALLQQPVIRRYDLLPSPHPPPTLFWVALKRVVPLIHGKMEVLTAPIVELNVTLVGTEPAIMCDLTSSILRHRTRGAFVVLPAMLIRM